ncbi:MAG: T9SS type A sorting domain-containing protein [Bacteroidota bacterium]
MSMKIIGLLLAVTLVLGGTYASLEAQIVEAGIFHSGGTLQIKAKPSTTVSSKTITTINIAIRWPDNPSYAGVTLGNFTNTMGIQGPILQDGGYNYALISGNPNSSTGTWTAGTEITLFTCDVSGGTGTGTFELTNDTYTQNQGCAWYFELFSPLLDATDYSTAFYSASIAAVPLPVQLVSFSVIANRLSSQLSWSTATETNNYGFDIERRIVGSADWTKVGFVAGAGTSTAKRDYTYEDGNLAPGRYAYRIKQVDQDGTFKYSSAAEVEIGIVSKEFRLDSNYPNPFNPSTKIDFSLAKDGRASLKVYNVIGQQVATLFDGVAEAGKLYQTRFDAASLPTGIYFARLESDGQRQMKKMLFVK